jgi:hypothetical protein
VLNDVVGQWTLVARWRLFVIWSLTGRWALAGSAVLGIAVGVGLILLVRHLPKSEPTRPVFKTLQEECGHSSSKTTMGVYGHLFESSSERTAAAMEQMFQRSLVTKASNVVRMGNGR